MSRREGMWATVCELAIAVIALVTVMDADGTKMFVADEDVSAIEDGTLVGVYELVDVHRMAVKRELKPMKGKRTKAKKGSKR